MRHCFSWYGKTTLLAVVGSRGLVWRAITGVAGKHSHLLLSRKGPAVLGGCAVPNTRYPPPTDPEPTSSLTAMSRNPDNPGKGSPGNSET